MATNNVPGLLTSLDELFTTQEQRDDAQREKVIDIPLQNIHDFPDHPFRVVRDEAMEEMAESIRQFGVLVPAMVRPRESGGYELISGHRRKMASALVGRTTLPCIVRDLTNDEATIVMVDSNLQREHLLPSEKAKAYKMKLDAIKHQGKSTSRQVGEKSSWAVAQVSADADESERQVHRYVRLNNLIEPIMSLVDEGKIGMTPAVELSYLKPEEQEMLADTIDSEQSTPSLSQAQRMRKMSNAGELDDDSILQIMMEQKKPPLAERQQKSPGKGGITISEERLQSYFPCTWDHARMEKMIYSLLDAWVKHRDRRKEPER